MCWDWLFSPSSPEEAAKIAANNEINKKLTEDKKTMERTVKLLLLGSGESGKSTFIKQLKIISGEDYHDNDRRSYVPVIRSNVLEAIRSILAAMTTLYIEFEDQERADDRAAVLTYDPNTAFENMPVEAIIKLWSDGGVKQCFDRSREYQLIDSAQYYLEKVREIGSIAFMPENQDILRSRKKTIGIVEYVYDLKKVQMKVIDVGGQRKERRKWIQCFENVTSIIFLASLSDYDLKIEENNSTNRMSESLELFETILQYPWFTKQSIILFLNKTDLFEKKMPLSNLADYFPQYMGSNNDIEEGKQFIRSMYDAKKPSHHSGDSDDATHIFCHYTCATDTQNITTVFRDVKEIILRAYLNEFNLV